MLRIDSRTDVLAVIDTQPTFMPGGELPVLEGDAIIPLINHLLLERFDTAFATQDWHPLGHSSFASTRPGARPYDVTQMPYGPQILWPDHAIQGSSNSSLHPDLVHTRLQMILRKGADPQIDSYSAFRENDRTTSTGLAGWLHARALKRVFFCGLALDFCVAWSALDAVAHGLEAVLLTDACRGIGVIDKHGCNSIDLAYRKCSEAGVRVLTITDLCSR